MPANRTKKPPQTKTTTLDAVLNWTTEEQGKIVLGCHRVKEKEAVELRIEITGLADLDMIAQSVEALRQQFRKNGAC
jgi:hypothetical protein